MRTLKKKHSLNLSKRWILFTLRVCVEGLNSLDKKSFEMLSCVSSESDSEVIIVSHIFIVSEYLDRRWTSLDTEPVSGDHVVSTRGVRSSSGVGVHPGGEIEKGDGQGQHV